MSDSITTISDKGEFASLIQNYFSKGDIFVRTSNGDIKIQYLGYSQDKIAFRIARVKNSPETITAFTRTPDRTIYASLRLVESNEDTFIFQPVKFQVITQAIKEERKNVTGGSKNIIYVSNIMSDTYIASSLESSSKIIDQIKERVLFDFKKNFSRLRIMMINEMKFDQRMRHMQETMAPIVIMDMKAIPDPKNEKEHYYYINEIYAKDYKLSGQKDIISEISVPIIYRNIIAYGYVQANNASPMIDAHLTVLKRTAISINDALQKEKVFEPAQEKFLISDISNSGLGIVFKDRKQLRYFRQDSMVSLDMALPTMKKASMGVAVRNISFLDNSIIKVGMQILAMDAISEVNYEEYMDSVKKGD